jgi:hypothetical protein
MPPSDSADPDLQARLLEAGRAEAEARGWPWLDPVEIGLTRASPGARQWTLRSNANARGRNVRVVVAEPDFRVVEAGFLPR